MLQRDRARILLRSVCEIHGPHTPTAQSSGPRVLRSAIQSRSAMCEPSGLRFHLKICLIQSEDPDPCLCNQFHLIVPYSNQLPYAIQKGNRLNQVLKCLNLFLCKVIHFVYIIKLLTFYNLNGQDVLFIYYCIYFFILR